MTTPPPTGGEGSDTGDTPLTFVATFQQLSAAGQTFPLDAAATAYLGGTIANISPGDKVETPLVYDVPVGTTPDFILLRVDPSTPGRHLAAAVRVCGGWSGRESLHARDELGLVTGGGGDEAEIRLSLGEAQS
jgi:hypothetical protein